MSLQRQPRGWRNDPLASLMDTAHRNSYAMYHQKRSEWDKLRDIHLAFEAWSNAHEGYPGILPVLLVARAHAAYLAAVRLVAGAQPPESYACLRLALENALVALYVTDNTPRQEMWLKRHDSDEAQAAVRQSFSNKKLMTNLNEVNASVGNAASKLYERCIDMGAHPNERAVTVNISINKTEETTEFENILIATDGPALQGAIKSTAQVGVCCLTILQLVSPERSSVVGLDACLGELKRGL